MDRILQDRRILAELYVAIDADRASDPALLAAVRRTGPRVGLRGVPPRLTSAELIAAGVSAELLAMLALRRASSGRVAKSDDHYYDDGFPMPSFLTQILDELTDGGLLTLTDDGWGMRRLHLTDAGRTRYSQFTMPRSVVGPRPDQSASSAGATATGGRLYGSVLVPIPGVHYECAQPPGHDTGPDPTPCTDTAGTITW